MEQSIVWYLPVAVAVSILVAIVLEDVVVTR